MTEPTITIPRLLLISHIKDINHELKNLLAVADHLAVIDMQDLSIEIGNSTGGIVATLTSIASYMKPPIDEVTA